MMKKGELIEALAAATEQSQTATAQTLDALIEVAGQTIDSH